MNNVIMIGALGRDPEVRVAGNTTVARYSLGVNNPRAKKDGDNQTDWFNCVSFGKQAEFVEKYLKKGTKIAISGELHNNNYTDKDGKTVYGMQITVNSIEFAGAKSDSQSQPAAAQPQQTTDGFQNIPDGIEELPFM